MRIPILLVRSHHRDLQAWEANGFRPFPCTLLIPRRIQVKTPEWSRFSAVIISSIYAAEGMSIPASMPVFCVGDKVGESLKIPPECRFPSIKKLCRAISSIDFSLPALHIRGGKVAFSLENLAPHLEIKKLISYKMISPPSSDLKKAKKHVEEARRRGVKIVVLYSGENARAFHQHFPDFPYESSTAACMGSYTAAAAKEMNWGKVVEAPAPKAEDLYETAKSIANYSIGKNGA